MSLVVLSRLPIAQDACQHPYTQFLPVFTFAVAITSQDVAIGIVGILHPFTLGVTYTTEYDATMLMVGLPFPETELSALHCFISLQNFLLCIESALWGLWFSAVFGVGEFKGVYPSPHGWLRTEVVLFLQPGQFGRDDLHDPIPPQAWATGGGPSRSIADLPVENPLVEDLDGDDHVDPHDVHVVDVGAAHHDDQAEWSNPAEPPTAAIRGPRQPGVGFSLRERSNLERLEGELPPDSLSGGAPIISNE